MTDIVLEKIGSTVYSLPLSIITVGMQNGKNSSKKRKGILSTSNCKGLLSNSLYNTDM